MKPLWPTYTEGKTNLKTFGTLFVEQAEHTDYPKTLWTSTYCNLLNGLAQNLAAMFKSQTPDCTFEQLREYVESALARDQDHTARATFRTHKRKKGTSVVSYVGELRNMGYRCYGSSSEPWTPAQVEERVLEVFLTNTGGELGRQLRMRFPRTLTEAIDIARNLEIEGVVDDSMEVVAYARNITNQANNVLNGREGGNYNNQRGG